MGYFDISFIELLDNLKYIQDDTLDKLTPAKLIDYNAFVDAEYIHNTTAIEGNRLSLTAVKKLLKEPSFRMCIWGVTEREFDEVLNYKEVLPFRRNYAGNVDLYFIKQLHKCIMANILELPGEFRTHNNIYISGVDKLLTPADLIEEELQSIINEHYIALENDGNPFEEAMLFHYRFESIHPFLDGNGRTGREILNSMIESAGYPMMLFTGNRMRYLSLLEYGDEGNFKKMVNGFAEIILQDYRMPWSL